MKCPYGRVVWCNASFPFPYGIYWIPHVSDKCFDAGMSAEWCNSQGYRLFWYSPFRLQFRKWKVKRLLRPNPLFRQCSCPHHRSWNSAGSLPCLGQLYGLVVPIRCLAGQSGVYRNIVHSLACIPICWFLFPDMRRCCEYALQWCGCLPVHDIRHRNLPLWPAVPVLYRCWKLLFRV